MEELKDLNLTQEEKIFCEVYRMHRDTTFKLNDCLDEYHLLYLLTQAYLNAYTTVLSLVTDEERMNQIVKALEKEYDKVSK